MHIRVKNTLTVETLVLQEVIEVAIMIKYMLLKSLKLGMQNQTSKSKSLYYAWYTSKNPTKKVYSCVMVNAEIT